MKRLVVLSSLCALALTAYAQNTDDQKVVVPASKGALERSYMSPGDFAQYSGAYDLSNGKTLHLTRKTTRLFARIDQQTEHEITRVGNGKFHALDGSMSMHVVIADDDSVSGELSYIDEQQPVIAGMPARITQIRFAAR